MAAQALPQNRQPANDALPLPLPSGWRHSAAVARIRSLPHEQRTTVLAGLFALAAALWAPLGIFAVLGGWSGRFLLVSAVLLAAALAPLPVAASERLMSMIARTRDAGLSLGRSVGQSIPRSAR